MCWELWLLFCTWIHLIISVAAFILSLAASWRNIMQDRNRFPHFPCFPFQFWLVMQYLSEMTEEQTLVMYSGHPLGLFPSHRYAPRLIITNGMVGVNILFSFLFFSSSCLCWIRHYLCYLNLQYSTPKIWGLNSAAFIPVQSLSTQVGWSAVMEGTILTLSEDLCSGSAWAIHVLDQNN